MSLAERKVFSTLIYGGWFEIINTTWQRIYVAQCSIYALFCRDAKTLNI